MEAKQLRKRTKLSQSEFAKKFGIPVRTLQQWEQGVSDPLPYLISLIQGEISEEEFLDVTKYMIKPKKSFDVVIPEIFQNAARVHPIMQKRVLELVKTAKKDKNIKKVVIFGSSITPHCSSESDIDVYYELLEEKKIETVALDCPIDRWTNFSVEPEMLEEIRKTGVVVYGHNKLL